MDASSSSQAHHFQRVACFVLSTQIADSLYLILTHCRRSYHLLSTEHCDQQQHFPTTRIHRASEVATSCRLSKEGFRVSFNIKHLNKGETASFVVEQKLNDTQYAKVFKGIIEADREKNVTAFSTEADGERGGCFRWRYDNSMNTFEEYVYADGTFEIG